jgi:hypothetical protein
MTELIRNFDNINFLDISTEFLNEILKLLFKEFDFKNCNITKKIINDEVKYIQYEWYDIILITKDTIEWFPESYISQIILNKEIIKKYIDIFFLLDDFYKINKFI